MVVGLEVAVTSGHTGSERISIGSYPVVFIGQSHCIVEKGSFRLSGSDLVVGCSSSEMEMIAPDLHHSPVAVNIPLLAR